MANDIVYREWGEYVVIDSGPGYKVKKLIIRPGKSISLQYHAHREEHWVVLSGEGTVVISCKAKVINPGDYVYVAINEIHKIVNGNNLDLEIIEVQRGEIIDEEDITRLD